MAFDASQSSRTRASSSATLTRDIGASPLNSRRRVRHLASVHLRNFRPLDNDNVALHSFSLALCPRIDAAPVFFTDVVLGPCVHADWQIDVEAISRGQASTFCSKIGTGFAGQSRFCVDLWALKIEDLAPKNSQGLAHHWSLQWQKEIDLQRLERIPGGLESVFTRRLPTNTLIVGMSDTTWTESDFGEPAQSQENNAVRGLTVYFSPHHQRSAAVSSGVTREVSHRLRAGSRAHGPVSYYCVPTRRLDGEEKARAWGGLPLDLDVTASSLTGSDREDARFSSDESQGGDRGGYDSETAYELTANTSLQCPGVGRRRSSSHTVRVLKRNRQKKSWPKTILKPDSPRHKDSSDEVSFSVGSQDSQIDIARRHRVQQWQVERRREREVMEKSKRETRMLHSYDYKSLMSLLEQQVTAAELTDEVVQLRDSINGSLCRKRDAVSMGRRKEFIRGRCGAFAEQLDQKEAAINILRSAIDSIAEGIARRRARLEAARQALADDGVLRQRLHRDDMEAIRLRGAELGIMLHNRRACILDKVSRIFPIHLVSPSDLLFSICDLSLPNSPAVAFTESRGSMDGEEIAAALGFAAQVTILLSSYLDTPLHYEIASAGSRAMMRDGISIMNGPRSFPLYSRGVELYRFEYGVFLLNKDIEQLLKKQGLPVLDLRHILPNLNSLTLTMSSPLSVSTGQRNAQQSAYATSEGTMVASKGSGYRTAGKSESVLPAPVPQASEWPSRPNQQIQGSGNGSIGPALAVENQTAKAVASPAASWTASLLAWTNGGIKTAASAKRASSAVASRATATAGNGLVPTSDGKDDASVRAVDVHVSRRLGA